jgi:predicted SprT family Zn-dependent metalloprotease
MLNHTSKKFNYSFLFFRCHSYTIRTKFNYVCEKCGYTIGRHSKSLDTERKVCGHCHGRFRYEPQECRD